LVLSLGAAIASRGRRRCRRGALPARSSGLLASRIWVGPASQLSLRGYGAISLDGPRTVWPEISQG
jgi:hypothetical protein